MFLRFFITCLLLSGWVWAQAEPKPRLIQSHFNAQLQIQDSGQFAQSIDRLCRECQGHISNLSRDQSGGSGSINLRIPEDQLPKFSEGLRKLASFRSENRSTSDNTASYLEMQRNLTLAEKALSAQWNASGPLTAAERGQVDAEFKAHLRDRINSYRSSMSSYQQSSGFSEVSLSWSPLEPPAPVVAPPLITSSVCPATPSREGSLNPFLLPTALLLGSLAYFAGRWQSRSRA